MYSSLVSNMDFSMWDSTDDHFIQPEKMAPGYVLLADSINAMHTRQK